MHLRVFVFLTVIAFGFLPGAVAHAQVSEYGLPELPTGYVMDEADMFSASDEARIAERARALYDAGLMQLSIITIKSLGTSDIFITAQDIFDTYKIGDAETDNGLLLLIAEQDRKFRIHTGYGIEPIVPDLAASVLLDDVLTPAFRAGDYGGGVLAVIEKLEAATDGEPLSQTSQTDLSQWSDAIFFAVIFGFIVLQHLFSALYRYLGKTKSWWLGGVMFGGIGLVVGLLFGWTWIWVLISVVAGAGVGLAFDWYASKYPYKHGQKKHGFPWWIFLFTGGGSGGWGGGSSRGGFGGFGGGMSGGGGSSGGW